MKTKMTFVAALCAAGLFATPVLAQDQMADEMKDKAKSEMTDMAKDKMQDEATKVMTSEDGMMIKGESMSMEDKAMSDAKMKQKMMLEKKMRGEAGTSDTASSAKTYGDTGKMAHDEWSTPTGVKSDDMSAMDDSTLKGNQVDWSAEPMMEKTETAPAVTTVNIACPEGTTAQPDGTCMITGDYDAE